MRTTVVLACALLACRADGPATTDASAHAAARRGLLADDALLGATIAVRGEAEGLWPWLADDAVYLHPDAPLLAGAPAVRDFLVRTYPDRGAQTQRLHVVTGDVSGDAQLGYTFGWFDEDVRAAGVTTTRFGKYLATWRRRGARWRLVGFVRNPGARPPSPPPADAAILAGEHGHVQPGDPDALRDQAIAADAAFSALSVAQGYTVAFTTYGAADAVIAGGSDLFWNAAGVARALAGWTPIEELAWTPRLGGAAASGDLAFTVGDATFSVISGVSTDRSYTKYLTVWAHQADGSWRFLLDGGNARPGP
ncbi:MAG: nuclear transport factor 2 family protein [Kofleriaceae bacterium]